MAVAKRTPQRKRAAKTGKRKPPNRGANDGKMGRPTRYRKEFVETVKLLCEKGMTDKECAEVIGVAESTISLWKIQHPDFGEAMVVGKEFADRRVIRSMYQSAVGFRTTDEREIYDGDGKLIRREVNKREHPPSDRMSMFWITNRQGKSWRHKQEFEVKAGVSDLSDDALREEIEMLMAKHQELEGEEDVSDED